MKLIEAKKEYTLFFTEEEVLTIQEGLACGSQYRLERADQAAKEGQNSPLSCALEGRKSKAYNEIRKQLLNVCKITSVLDFVK